MTTAGKLHRTSQLTLAGEVNELLPPVHDGLLAYYPMKQNLNGIYVPNIGADIDSLIYPSNWVVGSSGSQSGFSQNGETSCNSIILADDPWGRIVPVWRSYQNDVASNADGGWATSTYNIPNTNNAYRFTTWIRRIGTQAHGSIYLGVYGRNSAGSNVGVYELGTTTTNTNPYFYSSSTWWNYGEWYLISGILHPNSYSSSTKHADNGIWALDGSKKTSIRDFRMRTDNVKFTHRTYLYYSTNPRTNQQWVYPRVDELDGTEPSIDDLLSGRAYGAYQPDQASNLKNYVHGCSIENAETVTIDIPYWGSPINNSSSTSTVNTNDHSIGRLFPDVQVVSIEKTNGLGNSAIRTAYKNSGLSEGDTFSASIWAWIPRDYADDATIYLRHYHAAGNNNIGTLKYYDENGTEITSTGTMPRNKWIPLYLDQSTALAANPSYLCICHYVDGNGDKIYLTAPTILENSDGRKHAIDYHSGASSKGRLDIELGLGTSLFTICGWLHPHSRWDDANGTYLYTENQAAVWSLYDRTDVSYLHHRFYQSSSQSNSFLDPDPTSVWSSASTSNHNHKQYTIDAHKPVFFVIRRTNTTRIACQLWQAGSWKSEHSTTLVDPSASADELQFGNTNLWEGVRRDIAVYTRSLSTTELEKIINSGMSLTSDGDVHNILDELALGPNLWPNALDLNTTYGVQSGGTLTKVDGEYHQLVMSGAGGGYRGHDIACEANEWYVFSGELYKIAGSDSTHVALVIEGETGGTETGYTSFSSIPADTWTRVRTFAQNDAGATLRFLVYPSGTNGTYRWRNMQVRKIPSEAMKLHRAGIIDVGELIEAGI